MERSEPALRSEPSDREDAENAGRLPVLCGTEQRADGGLAFNFGIQVVHVDILAGVEAPRARAMRLALPQCDLRHILS